VAAFIAEPVVGATAGCVPAPEGYFRAVREICDRHGALLILDEVMCGMGRTGTTHAWEQEGIAPDIQAIAKGLGGGYQPIGAMLARAEIIDTIRKGSGAFQHGHTYMAHPLACAAALEVQLIIRDEKLLDQVKERGKLLERALTERLGNHRHIGDIRGRGLFQAIELVADRTRRTPFDPALKLHQKIKAAAFENGLACYPAGGTVDGRSGDHVLLAPPYIATPDDIDLIGTASAATLDTVKQRGSLVCGVSTGFAGFSAPDSQGNFKGLDVDYCRALAAGVLGDPTKVRYVALTAQNRFTALQSGEIDVLYRNSTETFLRGVTLGLRQGPINFYDGQGFVVRKDSGVKDLKSLNGATVCVAQGTTHEVTLGDYGRANNIDWKPLVFDRVDTMYQTFFGGRCDVMTQDASALAGAVATAAPNAADYVVLPQTISKEPLGPFTRNGDEVWSDIITWLHYGLIEAEELGVTQANVEEMAKSSSASPAIQRLLGTSGDLGSRLGLDNKWLLQAIKAGGTYGEIFERNVGQASSLKLERGLNGLWTKGGLMYAIPFK
jgi:general L-amino acid transport system substrate-binding protein